MPINPFKLERYFAKYEFKVEYLLSPSDCESLSLRELLQLADADSLQLWEELRLGYTESQGYPDLRAEVARLYPRLSPDGVMIAVPEEAIFIAMNTLLSPGDQVIAVFPAYQSLYEIANSIGCEVILWRFKLNTDRWWLDLDDLESQINDHTRMIVLNFPHNPTGYLLTHVELERIIELARKRGVYIFSDEMYRLLEYQPDLRLQPVVSIYERGISLSGLSKAFALPGLRLGWLATQDLALIDRWLTFKDYTTICNSAPSEVLGLMALRVKEAILQRNLGLIQENLKHAERFFTEHQNLFTWLKPMAGSVAFPVWTGSSPVESFCQRVLDQAGVMIVPGSVFDFPGNHFRIGLGRKNLPLALERVDNFIENYL